jgi:hypothetical protein
VDRLLLDRLREHQRTAEAIIDRATPLLQPEATPDPAALGRLRWEMARALTAYQQFKHRSIFDPAIERGGPDLQRMSEALKADCTAIGDEFNAYVRHWGAQGSADNWVAYRRAALTMIGRVRRHLAREERTVTSLLRAAQLGAVPVWRRTP